jgi:type IX secretion system PorP/SprF family membrane protein
MIIEVLLSFLIYLGVQGQEISYNGFEFYNPYLLNPAMISTEKTTQLDIIGYSQLTSFTGNPKGFLINSNSTIKKLNSSFQLQYNYDEIGATKSRNFQLGYSYSHTFSKNLAAMMGVSFSPKSSHFKLTWTDYPDLSNTTTEEERKSKNIYTGFGLKYKEFILSSSFGYKMQDYSIEKSTDKNDTTIENYTGIDRYVVTLKYQFRFFNKLTLTPEIIYIKHKYNYDGSHYDIYLGTLFEYNDFLGIGLTYTSNLSIISTIKLFDRLEFLVVMYNNETILYDSKFGWNLMGQIKILI